jgi:8-oxo-dGTP pyrophosphatase MutT (NUDIX family)
VSHLYPREKYTTIRHAAVLVLLYEQNGQLRVLLTTRAKTLRTHPGQTALPGGGKDDEDETIVHTAVGLTIRVPTVCGSYNRFIVPRGL